MISGLVKRLFGTSHEREVAKLLPLVQRINALELEFQKKTDAALQGMTGLFFARLDKGEPLQQLLPEAFATVREASRRVLGMRHYDVQLIGGMVLHRGAIAEMRTGEGKTLVATCPLYLNALERKGAHLVTVNDYLALRDAEWMGKVYRYLGMSVGTVVHGRSDEDKQKAYRSHITYGTNNEFGFDYLRDNMKESIERYTQRDLHYAIVDEVDSILIDEARTPLIISGPAEQSAALYRRVDQVIPALRKDMDYVVDEKHHSVMLTDAGVEKVERQLGIANLYDPQYLAFNHHVQQALRAHTLYKRDVHYVVTQDDKIVIVDEFTGRLMAGRRWSDGLHQAVEAKENVPIEEETQTLATISFQNLFRLYGKLAGMTGTADTEAEEFHKIYKLDVVSIPTHRKMIRVDQSDLIYKNERGKFQAVVAEVEAAHKRGQPVLVGTVSVEKSEVLSALLKKKGIPHTVLNAKQHAREAAIVAQAGRVGAVTIATNMAGRGTDILLGGNAEFMARAAVYGEEMACLPGACDETSEAYQEALRGFKVQTEAEKVQVVAAGGLHIIGTERHESRRIDNQLRGRAGRQGDPGSSRFYLSLEDDLMRVFGGNRFLSMMESQMDEEEAIESKMVTRAIEKAQRKIEAHHFDSRKHLLDYDDVMNQQRKAIYALRRQVLEGVYAPSSKKQESVSAVQDPAWTQEVLVDKVPPVLQQLVEAYYRLPTETKETEGHVVAAQDHRWLTHEVYRRFGAVCSFETIDKEKSEALAVATQQVTASLQQQRERVLDLIEQQVIGIISSFCTQQVAEDEWDIPALERALRETFGARVSLQGIALDRQELAETVWGQVDGLLQEKMRALGAPFQEPIPGLMLLYFARLFLLEEIDAQWIDHLKAMDYLREGIGFRGYGQKDPKQEYKQEGYALFLQMMDRIAHRAITKLFHVQIQASQQDLPPAPSEEARAMTLQHGEEVHELEGSAQATISATIRRDQHKVGRNDPCPCGSGKKYKRCHGTDAS